MQALDEEYLGAVSRLLSEPATGITLHELLHTVLHWRLLCTVLVQVFATAIIGRGG